MHELSLCRAIAATVEQARAGRVVEVVSLQVGQLRQVVPDTLQYCWTLVTVDSALAGSRLVIDHVPVRLSCRDCAAQTRVQHALVLVCAECGGAAVDVVAGEEFMITSIDVRPAESTPNREDGDG
jgi:hydrogenase nickel incorporation protein HypA/HybF